MEYAHDPAEVASFEHATWARCADRYVDGFGQLVCEAIDPLLDAASVAESTRVLDLGSGPGLVAAAARGRGAHPIGLDFSEDMLRQAREQYPGIEFRQGDADTLPFPDDEFDAVVANFVVHHLARPDVALAEAHRVLRTGGRVAFTVWADMSKLDAFGLFFTAVEEHAGAAELPHGPLFGVSEFDAFHDLMAGAGFRDSRVEEIEIAWRTPTLDTFLAAFSDWAAMDTFPAEVSFKIRATVRENGMDFKSDGQFVIPNPAIMVSAAK